MRKTDSLYLHVGRFVSSLCFLGSTISFLLAYLPCCSASDRLVISGQCYLQMRAHRSEHSICLPLHLPYTLASARFFAFQSFETKPASDRQIVCDWAKCLNPTFVPNNNILQRREIVSSSSAFFLQLPEEMDEHFEK